VKRRKLKNHFIAIIAVTFVLPATVSLVLSYAGARVTMGRMVRQQTQYTLREWHEEFMRIRQARLSVLINLITGTHDHVHQFAVVENEERRFEKTFDDRLADFLCANYDVYQHALWVAANGKIRSKFTYSDYNILPEGRPVRVEKRNYDTLDEQLAVDAGAHPNEGFWFGPLHITERGYVQVVGVALRKNSAYWNYPEDFGTLYVEVYLETLFRESAKQARQLFAGAVPMVVDNEGTILFHRQAECTSQKFEAIYRKSPPEGYAASLQGDATKSFFFFTPVNEQWRLAVLLDEDEFSRYLQPLYLAIIGILGLGFVVAIALLGWAFRQLGRAIGQLSQGAQALAAGNLEMRLAIDRDDELGLLGTAFNNMAESLKNLISERAEKEKLLALNQLKDAFISNVSHELKAPLTHIDLGVQNLQRGVGGGLSDKQITYLARIQENARRLLRMIRELLDVSRIEAGRLELLYSQVSVRELLDEVIEEARPQWQMKKLRVTGRNEDAELQVPADRDKLKQVISNLLDNAMKFTGEDGEIVISAARQNGTIELTVADSGMGIAPEYLPHIGERFYQAHSAENGPGGRKNGGLGLGLNIVKSLVELHQGKLLVESKVGVGTIVKVSLPSRQLQSK
jgi:signal transduction histidine kinase